jgi:lipopolysaccharide/colanic/teichoic acid biosynthesis glycosyltransferase
MLNSRGSDAERFRAPWRCRGLLKGARILLIGTLGHETEVQELLERQHEWDLNLMLSDVRDPTRLLEECLDKKITHLGISSEAKSEANAAEFCRQEGIELLRVDDAYEWLTGKLPLASCGHDVDGLLSSRRFSDRLQRVFSFAAASVGLILTLPLYSIIAAAIWIDDPGSVFFSQERLGRNGKRFTLIKFRTMRQTTESERPGDWMKAGLASGELSRVTLVGSFLRRCRLDELPQLWNVVSGDLNAVGPRAETPRAFGERSRVIEGYGARLQVVPGMAGWGLLNQYEDVQAKLQHDMFYIKYRSFGFDMCIFFETAWKLLGGRLK